MSPRPETGSRTVLHRLAGFARLVAGLVARVRALPVQAFAKRVRQAWRRRPARRPYLVALVAAPLVPVVLLVISPGTPQTAQAQAPPDLAPLTPYSPSPVSAAQAIKPADATAFLQRNPFALRKSHEEKPKPPPVVAQPVVPAAPAGFDPSTKLELLGTYVSEGGRWAIIRDRTTNKEDVYRVGMSPLPNASITQIEAREVRLTINGAEAAPLVIDYKGWKISSAAPPPRPGPDTGGYIPPPPDTGAPAAVTPDGPPRRLARQEVDTYLDNLNTLLTQVNIQPVFQGGQPAGFRLTDIQKGTILDQIGLQDGDTLRFVNGQRVDSVQSAFQLYNILKESTNVEITVLRNTRPTTLRYAIY